MDQEYPNRSDTNPAGTTLPGVLQNTQIEAHVNRLNAVRTQLMGYAAADGRAAEAMPMIDAVIASLQQPAFPPPTETTALASEDNLPFE